ncbi:winged helix-turn-helix transcriptional regulator [Companilactobacillus bobalius]|nr:helix-turn-helix domain-containing protein [Companilactobacillus bobalius]OVE96634.1 putative HTH-type transcriptional regulator YdeP [Companilactobacillus bobalius]GEO58387.1 transcriptional regulator [Companilactobacillus paralimentarius]
MVKKENEFTNGALLALNVMGNKWKPLIICHLLDGPLRTLELQRRVKGISAKVMVEQLKQLEADKIITRKVFNEIPPHVEYSLTPDGYSLAKVLGSMSYWGEQQAQRLNENGQKIKLEYTDHQKWTDSK